MTTGLTVTIFKARPVRPGVLQVYSVMKTPVPSQAKSDHNSIHKSHDVSATGAN